MGKDSSDLPPTHPFLRNCKLCANKIEEWTKEGLRSRKQISTQEKGSQSQATAPDLEDCWSGL